MGGGTPTEKAWARRIINGVILLNVSFIIYLSGICGINKILDKGYVSGLIRILSVICLLIAVMFSLESGDKEKYSLLKARDAINAIKDNDEKSVFLGFGWWQAPVLSYLTSIKFEDYYKVRNTIISSFKTDGGYNYYLISDFYSASIAKNALKEILEQYVTDVMYEDSSGKYAVYRLKEVKYDLTFTYEDFAAAKHIFRKEDAGYIAARGIYDYEMQSKYRWSRCLSAVLLNINGMEYVKVNFAIYNYNSMNNKDGSFQIYINNKVSWQKSITHDGIYEVIIPLDEAAKEKSIINIGFSYPSMVITNQDTRELSFVINEIEAY